MNEKSEEIQTKSRKSLKWSTLGEIIGRLITPVTTAILSRILAPEIFGIVTTITIVISFCEIFSEGGFAKYIIQSDFKDDDDKNKSLNVAFWSNFVLSTILFIIVCIFNKQVASLVGSDGYELPLIIACIQIPIYSISGTFTAIFRREFKFNKLFYVRVITALINLCCSVPLALLGFKHWSIIIGNIVSMLVSTIIMLFMSDWKPSFYFNLKLLRKMFSFSFINLIEALLVWLCSWISSIIISNGMSQYYLGIYKNATSMVNALFGIVTSAIIPVLFSSLSRLKDNEKEFINMYCSMQSVVAFILLPMGAGLFLYRNLATKILFGSQWSAANIVIGLTCVVSVLKIIFSYFASEAYRAKGRPIISIFTQIIFLLVSIPACVLTVNIGFNEYVIASSCASLSLVLCSFIFLKIFLHMPIIPILKNLFKPLCCTLIMSLVGILLGKISNSTMFEIVSIFICIAIYFGTYICFFRKDFNKKIEFIYPSISQNNKFIKRINDMSEFLETFFEKIIRKIQFFFSKSKAFWLLYLFSSLLFIGSTVLSIVGNNYTFDGKLENLSYQVARYAKDDEYETVSMNIEQNEINGEELVKEHNNYKYVNGYLSPQYRLNNCYIGINSNVSETFFLRYGNNDFSSKSIIFPNVFSSSEKKIKNEDGIEEIYYKMDDMNLYFKFKDIRTSGYGVNWCIISSNYAEIIKNELGLDSLEDVIGNKVDVKYSVLDEENHNNWTIIGIYDSNLGDAKHLTQQYGDFILSWLIYTNYREHMYYNLKGLSLNYNLHYSIKNNNNVIKRELNKLNPTENKYTFLTNNSNDYGINNFLENSLLDVNNKRDYKFLNAYNICSIILYVAVVVIVIITFFINSKKTNIGIAPFIFLILILTICFGIIQLITLHLQSINYATSLVVYHGSQSLIVIYELILVYLLSIKLISYKFNKSKRVISND